MNLIQDYLLSTGANCIFAGVVRASLNAMISRHHLEYEAYQPMAEEKMNQIANEIDKMAFRRRESNCPTDWAFKPRYAHRLPPVVRPSRYRRF
jgi:hypothetical protein